MIKTFFGPRVENLYKLWTTIGLLNFRILNVSSIPTNTNEMMLPQFDGHSNSLGPMVGCRSQTGFYVPVYP